MAFGDPPSPHSVVPRYPSQVAYQDVVQNPALAFADPLLRTCKPMDFTPFGLPVPISGQFANVYRMQSPDGGQWAVKLFLRYLPGRTPQYRAVQDYLLSQDPPPSWLVPFSYQEQGIRAEGGWFPLLQMPWISDAVPLNEYITEAIAAPISLQPLLDTWRDLIADMGRIRFAHGDLQHGNVFVRVGRNGEAPTLLLLDYDAAYVPTLRGGIGTEVGHPAYQHPERSGTHYGPFQDRFAAVAVAAALLILIHAPELWYRFDNGDNVLFRREDFVDTRSEGRAFYLLERYSNPAVRHVARVFRNICENPLRRVPDLERFLRLAQPPVI